MRADTVGVRGDTVRRLLGREPLTFAHWCAPNAQAIITGTPEQVAEGLGRYMAAGARHLVVRLGALGLHSQRDQLERIACLIPMLG